MALNVKTIEMVAKIQSRQRKYVRSDFSTTMDDLLSDMYVYVKKRRKELEEENREYRNDNNLRYQ